MTPNSANPVVRERENPSPNGYSVFVTPPPAVGYPTPERVRYGDPYYQTFDQALNAVHLTSRPGRFEYVRGREYDPEQVVHTATQ
jgi:hypothetical protein